MLKTKMGIAFLKLLLSGCLIIAAVDLSFAENWRNSNAVRLSYRLPNHIVPTHYDIKLIPYKKEDNHSRDILFEGECSIRIHITCKTQNISFHTLNIDYRFIMLINEGNGKIHIPIRYSYNNKTQIYVLHFDEVLSLGIYTLEMKFFGIQTYNTKSFLKISYTNGADTTWLNVTNFQIIGARRMFPCWDEPAFKATFNISVHHHENYTALSNMPIRDIEHTENNMVWTHFRTTPVMSTYLVTVAVTNFHHFKMNFFETMWCRKHSTQYTKLAQNVSKIIASHLTKINWESLRDLKKEISKTDHIIIPEFPNISNWRFRDGMSKWGLIFYREMEVIYNEELDPVARKIEVTRSVAHEMVHHWCGNLVSPSWGSSLWINDGIVRLLAVDAVNKTLPDSRMLDLFVVQIQRDSLHLDTHSLMMPLEQEINTTADINSLFISVPYIKAPGILRMLQHIVTNAVFWKGIDKYLNIHQFSSSTTTNDLWTAMQVTLTESDYKDKFNITYIMNTWITQSQYPVMNVTRARQTGDIIISQESGNFINKWVAITYTTQTELNFNNTLPRCWLGPNTSHIEIPEIDSFDWIILNLQQTGYYRVNYDLTTWRRIVRYLNSDSYANIHVLNRAQIIDDIFYLAMERKSNFSRFWELTNYLSRETDYVAWYPIIKAFEYLSTFILFSEIRLEEKMLQLLPILLKKIRYQEDPNENDLTKCLRQEITKWACVLGNSDCRNKASVKLQLHLANPGKHKILPWWKDWTFCKGLIKANSSVWMKMMDIYNKEPNSKILEYLTCSEDSYIIQTYLEQISSNDNVIILKNKDRINIFLHIVAKHAKNDEIFEYVLENFEKIKPRQVSTVAALIIILNHGYTKERQYMILSKFKHYLRKEQIIKTIKYKLSSRKERFEMIQKIMSNDLKKNVGVINEEKEEVVGAINKGKEEVVEVINEEREEILGIINEENYLPEIPPKQIINGASKLTNMDLIKFIHKNTIDISGSLNHIIIILYILLIVDLIITLIIHITKIMDCLELGYQKTLIFLTGCYVKYTTCEKTRKIISLLLSAIIICHTWYYTPHKMYYFYYLIYGT